MRHAWSLFLLLGLLASCGSGENEPLTPSEINDIEDRINEAVKKGKLTTYADPALQHEQTSSDYFTLVPLDSNNRSDLAGFTSLTEEEYALENGDFAEESRELKVIAMITQLKQAGYTQQLAAGYASIDEVEKVLKKSQAKKFRKMLEENLERQEDRYEQNIRLVRIEAITEDLYQHLKLGNIAAYENENLARIIQPEQLENLGARTSLIQVPDPHDDNNFKDSMISEPIEPKDIVDFLPHFNEEEELVAISLIYLFEGADIRPRIPWVTISMDDLDNRLDPAKLDYLLEMLTAEEEEDEEEENDSTEV